jgi:hypothetical protein
VTEKLKYQLIESRPEFEIRKYPTYSQITVSSAGNFMSAGNRAFQPLVTFISGANQEQRKIAMTAPVIQQPLSDELHRVSFVLPEGIAFESIPVPRNSSIERELVAEHYVAAHPFRGSWNQERFYLEGERLQQALRDARLKTAGTLYWARFDPPWKPGFLKQNEVLIDLEGYKN